MQVLMDSLASESYRNYSKEALKSLLVSTIRHGRPFWITSLAYASSLDINAKTNKESLFQDQKSGVDCSELFHTTTGVPDKEQAQNAVDFASSVELLRKPEVQKLQLAEINLNDATSITSALPK